MKYAAAQYLKIAGRSYTPGEIISGDIPEEKRVRLLKLKAIVPIQGAPEPVKAIQAETPAKPEVPETPNEDEPKEPEGGAEDESEGGGLTETLNEDVSKVPEEGAEDDPSDGSGEADEDDGFEESDEEAPEIDGLEGVVPAKQEAIAEEPAKEEKPKVTRKASTRRGTAKKEEK